MTSEMGRSDGGDGLDGMRGRGMDTSSKRFLSFSLLMCLGCSDMGRYEIASYPQLGSAL